MPALGGRTAVVTGANSGIGLVTARELARVGAHVVLAVRDPERGRTAAASIAGSTDVRRLDLADLASVRAFAEDWEGDLDVLINNAGVMAIPQEQSVDGFEMQFATNHLGHFALTNLVLPHVTDRVVTVSSNAHRMGRIVIDDLNWKRRRYRAWAAYGQSKLANLLFTLELQRRLTAAGSSVRALAAHPGYAATNLQSHTGNPLSSVMMAVANRVVSQSDARARCRRCSPPRRTCPAGATSGPTGSRRAAGIPHWSAAAPLPPTSTARAPCGLRPRS